MASISLNHIKKVYPGDIEVISDLNLQIKDKEFVVLVGPSGCGKSTTLRMIAGLEEISDGEMYIGDRKVNDVAPKDRDIAMVFQNYALYPHMTVFDNMAFWFAKRRRFWASSSCSTASPRRCPAVSVSALRSAAQSSVTRRSS